MAVEVNEVRDKTGVLRERRETVDGRREGKTELFDPEGKLVLETIYKNGRKAEEAEYFPDGKLARKSSHLLLGVHAEKERIEYYQNGHPKEQWIKEFEAATPTKVAYKFYHDNGVLAEEGTSLNVRANRLGLLDLHGERKVYSREGNLLSHEFYDCRKKVGTWKQIGVGEIVESTFVNDKMVKLVKKDSIGRILSTEEFNEDGSKKT